jgi:hypothetical protein
METREKRKGLEKSDVGTLRRRDDGGVVRIMPIFIMLPATRTAITARMFLWIGFKGRGDGVK